MKTLSLTIGSNTYSTEVGLTGHDWRVILFHVVIAAIQAILLQLGKENFGTYTPYVVMGVQIVSEWVRRIVV